MANKDFIDRMGRFKAKEEEFDLLGEKLKIRSLTFPELTNFGDFIDKKLTTQAIDYVVFVTFRKMYPSTGDNAVSDDDIRNQLSQMDGAIAMQIAKKVQELSNMTNPGATAPNQVGESNNKSS